MASAAPVTESLLAFVARPRDSKTLGVTALFGTFAMIAYCVAHGHLRGFDLSVVPSLVWALAGVVPVVCAYESLKRIPDHLTAGRSGFTLVLLVASALVIGVSTSLTLLNEWFFFGEAPSALSVALARTPLISLLMLGSLVAIRLGRDHGPFAFDRASRAASLAPKAVPREPTSACNGERPSASITFLQLPDGQLIPDMSLVRCAIAAANYAEIRSGESAILTRVTMTDLEKLLAPHGFERIHRRTIINWAHAERVNGSRGRPVVHMRSGEQFVVGPTYKKRLLAQIGTTVEQPS